MKIAYIANIRLPTEKAHGVQIMKMCEAFAALGNEVMLVVPRRRNAIREDPFAYYSVAPTFGITRIFAMDFVRFWGRAGFFVQNVCFSLSAVWYIARTRPGLVYSRDPEVVAVAGFFGIKALKWETHTALDNFFVRAALRRAREVVCISNGLAQHYYQLGLQKSKTLVAHDAVDTAEFEVKESKSATRERLSLPQEKFIIEYVGKFRTMGHPKGVEEIIEMAGTLAQKHPNLFLLVVGLDAPELPMAQAIADRAGLSKEQSRFVPHIPRLSVPSYLHAADVLLMNYPDTPHYAHIMSPLKVFEYMASGVPILTTDLPSLREVLTDDSAYFVPADNVAALGRGVEALLANPALCTSLGERALKEVGYYSWRARAKRILAHHV